MRPRALAPQGVVGAPSAAMAVPRNACGVLEDGTPEWPDPEGSDLWWTLEGCGQNKKLKRESHFYLRGIWRMSR